MLIERGLLFLFVKVYQCLYSWNNNSTLFPIRPFHKELL